MFGLCLGKTCVQILFDGKNCTVRWWWWGRFLLFVACFIRENVCLFICLFAWARVSEWVRDCFLVVKQMSITQLGRGANREREGERKNMNEWNSTEKKCLESIETYACYFSHFEIVIANFFSSSRCVLFPRILPLLCSTWFDTYKVLHSTHVPFVSSKWLLVYMCVSFPIVFILFFFCFRCFDSL